MTSCSVSANVPLQFGGIRTGSRSSVCQSPFTCKKQKPSCKWLEEKGDFIGKKLGKLTDLRESLGNSGIFRGLRKRLGAGVWCCRLTPVTPNSYPFSSVTQEATEFLSLASGKHFKDKLISLAWVSFSDLRALDEANYQRGGMLSRLTNNTHSIHLIKCCTNLLQVGELLLIVQGVLFLWFAASFHRCNDVSLFAHLGESPTGWMVCWVQLCSGRKPLCSLPISCVCCPSPSTAGEEKDSIRVCLAPILGAFQWCPLECVC